PTAASASPTATRSETPTLAAAGVLTGTVTPGATTPTPVPGGPSIDPAAFLPPVLALLVAAGGAIPVAGIIFVRRRRSSSDPVTPRPTPPPADRGAEPNRASASDGATAPVDNVPSGYEIVSEPKCGGMACVYK